MNTILQNKIMRRIYYVFFVRTVANPTLLFGFFMLAMLIALTYFVSLGNVLQNMMQIQVGNLGAFTYNAFSNTEAWTLVILGIVIFSVLSFQYRPKKLGHQSHQFAHR